MVLVSAACATLSVAGCVDMDLGGPGSTELEQRQQAVSVVPEFTITGTDAVPASLYLTDLGLAVSEIRLEPLSSPSSLAYSTRDSMLVEFDLSQNQTTRTGEVVELPSAGRYLVSIRLEPIVVEGVETSSFSAHGFVIDDHVNQPIDEVADGEPQPMPFDPGTVTDGHLTDKQEFPTEWTPFDYQSKRAVFYTFSDVEFAEGQQFLTFSFDVRDWAVEVVDPITNAVRANKTDDTVDATKQIESSGTGAEALIETGVVRTDRRPTGT